MHSKHSKHSMGTKPAKESPAKEAAVNDATKTTEEDEAEEESFNVTLSTISGDQFIVSVKPSDRFSDLQKLAAAKLSWDADWTLRFADGTACQFAHYWLGVAFKEAGLRFKLGPIADNAKCSWRRSLPFLAGFILFNWYLSSLQCGEHTSPHGMILHCYYHLWDSRAKQLKLFQTQVDQRWQQLHP